MRKAVLGTLLGGVVGFFAGCVLDFDNQVIECWCGEQWQVQISGARTYNLNGDAVPISPSTTTHLQCVTMLQHLALADADPMDPLYQSLHAAMQAQAVANCETAGQTALNDSFSHTDCATTNTGGSVSTNLVHPGACWDEEVWNWEEHPDGNCKLDGECGEFYDCSRDKITRWHGIVNGETGGDTEGEIGDDGIYWECDGYAIGGPDSIASR